MGNKNAFPRFLREKAFHELSKRQTKNKIKVYLVWFGLVWFGLVWFGLVWFGLVWFGLVWFGLVCKKYTIHLLLHNFNLNYQNLNGIVSKTKLSVKSFLSFTSTP